MQTIVESNAAYEAALGAQMPLNQADLQYKHDRMDDADDPFPFFRGTYYRWVQHWSKEADGWKGAPKVLSVGDLHLENFGTWRDAETRLCWGINDFDEAEELPYSHDLIRLAASARLARGSKFDEMKSADVCEGILTGFTASLKAGGEYFVLEESHPELRALAMNEDPERFWSKFKDDLRKPPPSIPEDARALLNEVLPKNADQIDFRHRVRAGMGSLGRPRIVATCKHRGSQLAWEVKRAAKLVDGRPNRAAECVRGAIRSHDPAYQPGPQWIRRRLGPRYTKIKLDRLHKADVAILLRSMGAETANIHLGTPNAADRILADLPLRPKDWLIDTSKKLANALLTDWEAWKARKK